MKYRNTQTGAVIETNTIVSGGNWERVKELTPSAAAPAQEKKKSAAKKTK